MAGSSLRTVPDLVERLITEARNVTGQDNANMLKSIAELEKIKKFFVDWQNTTGPLVQTVIERILQDPFYDLKTSINVNEVPPPEVQFKAKFDKLNWIVSKLNQIQLPGDSDQLKDSPTVSNINEKIIPVIVARLDLADKYSLCLSQHPPEKNDSSSTGKKGGSHSSEDDYKRMSEQVHKLRNDLSYIRSFLKSLKDNAKNLERRLDNFEGIKAHAFVNALLRHSAFDDLETDRQAEAPRQLQEKLRVLNKVVIKLKHQISSPNKLSPTDSDDNWYKQVISEFDYTQALDIMPVLHAREEFKASSAFRDFREVYQRLELTTKLCLLCFATIPENEVVKKRFMTHWWVGEGFVRWEAADGIFQELVKKNCIEPFNEKFRSVVDSYKMDPCIRSAVIVLAKEAGFFDFDGDKLNPSVKFTISHRACLVDGFSQELLKIKNELLKTKNELAPEKVQVIFNVNEPYPDVFELEWFSKMKNVKVLYLGRWQISAKHHIEVESVEFLKGLESMKLLRFFSLQGISRISKLPDSVCKLLNLRILDLRACHNLEALPVRIGSLKKLTHLDISECYLLENMPKGIASLSELQVLKGFVISSNSRSKSCTLADLSKLKNLGKLSIYTNRKDFPTDKEITTFHNFQKLEKLTITWGAGEFPTKEDSHPKQDEGVPQPNMTATTTTPKNHDKGTLAQPIATTKKSPEESKDDQIKQNRGVPQPNKMDFGTLEKLDFKCYPCTTAPIWLRPGTLPSLKKLYIRGGNLQNMCPVQENDKWPEVKVLRLKFLSDLKIDYKKLRSSFPALTYLEKFKCPKLTYFPCNENGVVWLEP